MNSQPSHKLTVPDERNANVGPNLNGDVGRLLIGRQVKIGGHISYAYRLTRAVCGQQLLTKGINRVFTDEGSDSVDVVPLNHIIGVTHLEVGDAVRAEILAQQTTGCCLNRNRVSQETERVSQGNAKRRQVSGLLQHFFCRFALADIFEDDRHFLSFWFTGAAGIDIKPATHGPGAAGIDIKPATHGHRVILKARRFTCQGNSAVGFNPKVF